MQSPQQKCLGVLNSHRKPQLPIASLACVYIPVRPWPVLTFSLTALPSKKEILHLNITTVY